MYEPIKNVLEFLAGNCDGARSYDNVGFNKIDAPIMSEYTGTDPNSWTPAQAKNLWNRLKKYRGQWSSAGLDLGPEPIATYVTPHDLPGWFRLYFPYARTQAFSALLDEVKKIPGARFIDHSTDPYWAVAIHKDLVDSGRFQGWLGKWGFTITPEAMNHFSTCQAEYKVRKFGFIAEYIIEEPIILRLQFSLKSRDDFDDCIEYLKDQIESSARKFHKDETGNWWEVRVTEHNAERLKALLVKWNYTVPDNLFSQIDAIVAVRTAERDVMLQRSRAQIASEIQVIPGMNPNLTLRTYQHAAIEYVQSLPNPWAIIGDPVGLGKTPMSLAIALLNNAFPLLVISTPSTPYQWEEEVQRWLPGKTTLVVKGEKPLASYDADVVIIHDKLLFPEKVKKSKETVQVADETGELVMQNVLVENIVEAHKGLWNIQFQGIIADEIHHYKNYKSRRSQMLLSLMPQKHVRVRLGLSGTIAEKGSAELIHPLRCIGIFNDTFKDLPGKGQGPWQKYIYTFCGGYDEIADVWNLGVSQNEVLLNQMIREKGYIQRDKAAVLPELPEIIRTTVPIDMKFPSAYEGPTYEEAKVAFLEFMAAHQGSPSIQLAEIEKFMHTVEWGKVIPALQWLEEILEDGHKVVFGVHHRDVFECMRDLLREKGYDPALIQGGQDLKKRNEDIKRFREDPACQIILCSIEAASEGINLQVAALIISLVYRWKPSTHWQWEGRVHRMGQEHDSVMSVIIHARGTIDDWCRDRLNRRKVSTWAINSGDILEVADDFSDIESFINYVKTQPGSQKRGRRVISA
jgi:superfamily II DNA or RNA helicase